jgi:hypothetical protein
MSYSNSLATHSKKHWRQSKQKNVFRPVDSGGFWPIVGCGVLNKSVTDWMLIGSLQQRFPPIAKRQ